MRAIFGEGGLRSLFGDRKKNEPTSLADTKIDIIHRIRDGRVAGGSILEGVKICLDDPDFTQRSAQVFSDSLNRSRINGEQETGVENRRMDFDKISQCSWELAVAVEEGQISRVIALIIVQRFGQKLNKQQIGELAEAFVARDPDESPEEFQSRRQLAQESLLEIPGLTPQETKTIKDEVNAVAQTYAVIEKKNIGIKGWPKDKSGKLPNTTIVNRGKAVSVAEEVYDHTIAARSKPDVLVAEIKRGAEVPRVIDNLSQVVRVVEMNQGKIKGVTFDMFDTLVQWTSRHWEREVITFKAAPEIFARYGIQITPEEFQKYRENIWFKKYREVYWPAGKEFRASDALKDIVDVIAKDKKVSLDKGQAKSLADNLEDLFIDIDADTNVAMPGAIDVLRKLKSKGVKVAVVSNHPYKEASVRKLLARFGLSQYVDELIVSADAGYIKTKDDEQAKIFQYALGRLGLKPSEVVHAGDNAEADCEAPRRIGIRGMEYRNPNTFQKKIQNAHEDITSPEYKADCMKAVTETTDLLANQYYDRNTAEATPEALREYALRLYRLSRDYYAPLMIKFSEHCLDKLKTDPKALNINMGRDATATFLLQRRLIQTFPEKYGDIDPSQVQYVPISRDLVNNSDPKLLDGFLQSYGFQDSSSVNVIDNGFFGSIQDRLMELYPGKKIEGEFLMSKKWTDKETSNRNAKHGYVFEMDCDRKKGPDGNFTYFDHPPVGPVPEVLPVYSSLEFMWNQEDLWNGIFASPKALVQEGQSVHPKNYPKGKRARRGFVPGNADVIPGLDKQENYMLLKRMALKGIMDGVKIYRRQTQLGVAPTSEDAMRNMGKWFKESSQADNLDRQLIDGMVRERHSNI